MRKADRQYSAPGTNPILDRLRSFGQSTSDARACVRRVRRGLAQRARAAHGGGRRAGGAAVARHGGAHAGGGALLHRLLVAPAAALGLVICREFARHRIRRVSYIGVPRAVVQRRMQRGQLIGGPQARVPLYVPYADFFQYQAGAGRLAGRA